MTDDSEFRLYVFLRSDLASMTVGKAAAQVAHAASMAAYYLASDEDYEVWTESGSGFGTTIVLDGGAFDDGKSMEDLFFHSSNPVRCGTVMDPSYPIRDGKKTHHLELVTCHWMFTDRSDPWDAEFVDGFKLYVGNHDT